MLSRLRRRRSKGEAKTLSRKLGRHRRPRSTQKDRTAFTFAKSALNIGLLTELYHFVNCISSLHFKRPYLDFTQVVYFTTYHDMKPPFMACFVGPLTDMDCIARYWQVNQIRTSGEWRLNREMQERGEIYFGKIQGNKNNTTMKVEYEIRYHYETEYKGIFFLTRGQPCTVVGLV